MAGADPEDAANGAAPAQASRLARAFLAAWSAGDAAALGRLFAPDADFVNVAGLWWHGAERIARVHRTAFGGMFAGARLTEERLETRALGPAAATARVRARLEGQTRPDGRPADARRTLLLLVCADGPECWRIVAAQNTDVAPGAETMLAEGGALSPVRYG